VKLVECFLYDGEHEAVGIRFQEHRSDIDEYWVIESDQTFTGFPKPLKFHSDAAKYGWDLSRVKVWDISSERKPSKDPWVHEYSSRDFVYYLSDDLRDCDLLLVSDADEIASNRAIQQIKELGSRSLPIRLGLHTSYLFLDYQLVEPQWVANCSWAYVISRQHLRYATASQWRLELQAGTFHGLLMPNSGWHFSYLGGVERIRKKLESFSHTEFSKEYIPIDLDVSQLVRKGADLLRRPGYRFDLVDLGMLPDCVIDDLGRFEHLLFHRSQERQ